MVKDKSKVGPAQKHLHSRVSYLYQAATYLTENAIRQQGKDANCVPTPKTNSKKGSDSSSASPPIHSVLGEDPLISDIGKDEQTETIGPAATPSQRLLAHVRTILRKSQIRLAPHMKHSICKRCDALLLPGSTSTINVENKSKNGNKPWADVLVIVCNACGTAKRYPVGATRQLKRQERLKALPDTQTSKAHRATISVPNETHPPVSSDQPDPS